MMDAPLMYTSRGNVPIDSLRYEHEWVVNDEIIVLHERWFADDGELVKNNFHGYAVKGLPPIGGEQAKV